MRPSTLARATTTRRPPVTAPARTVARALPESPASAAATAAGASAAGASGAGSGGGSGGDGGGHDSDLIYTEMLRRVREEQEQLGQLINHPF
ncbi:MAG TPA: hypothetical protein VGH67_11900 [Solirubrobacteraceae bacterium]|jgi:hypothetical protein